ncbi:MAG: ATP-dependent sacrificial sulfur transferase LarE [Eubacteriales bacterium]
MELISKYVRLREILCKMGSVVVAYSGGVDSTFLLKVAWDVLGPKAIGVMGISETVPGDQIVEARKMAEDMGVPFLTVNTQEFHQEEFVSNPKNRCFHCKSELFGKLWQVARERNIPYLLDGCNADDAGDYRPGMEAGQALKVRSPLLEAGLTKEDIRIKSRQLGLPTWDRPSSPCLSSRFPYGTRITVEGLTKVEKAESYLKTLGFSQVRARYHENVLRIEVNRDSMPGILELAGQVVAHMKSIGFNYVTLDLAGYRMGSANEMLNLETKHSDERGYKYGTAN